MLCPYCNAKTQVTNSRSRAKGTQVWRRRACESCSAVWTTREQVDLSSSHFVVSDTGSVPFQRDKLFISIKDSLTHRKSALADATALTDTIIAQVLALKSAKIDSAQIKSITHSSLMRFDKTAAAVYAAVHEQ